MKLLLLTIFFLIFIPVPINGSLFKVLDETPYTGSLDIITEYPDPDMTEKRMGRIFYWIDIVGFEDVVRINGTEYCESPVPIVKYKIWSYERKNRIYIQREWSHVSGDHTIACVDLILKYKKRNRFGSFTKKERYIIVTKKLNPDIYPGINNSKVEITIFNNSFNPHVDIHIPVQEFETKTVITYQDQEITRYNMTGQAATGAVNLSYYQHWEDESDNFAFRNDQVILKYTNKSDFNISGLEIVIHTPYSSMPITNTSVEVVELDSIEEIIKPGIWVPLLLLFTFGYGARKCLSACGDII